jgi:group I intron endonuclease
MSEIKSEESKIGYIYSFTFPNSKQYIGQTIRPYLERWRQHKKVSKMPSAKEYDHLMYRAIRKYGWDNILKDVICSCNIEQINDLEILYIAKMKTLSPDEYNMTTGGSQNMIMSKESRTKMSNKAKERFSNPDAIAKISDAAKKRFADPDEKKAHSARMKNRDTSSFRRCEETKDLPKYVTISRNQTGIRYRIAGHPNCKSKYFSSDLLDEEGRRDSLTRCLQYLQTINDPNYEPDIHDKIAKPKKFGIIRRSGLKYPDKIDNNDSNDKKEQCSETKCYSVDEDASEILDSSTA